MRKDDKWQPLEQRREKQGVGKSAGPPQRTLQRCSIKYCDAVNKAVKDRVHTMWNAGLSEAIQMAQRAQLEDNHKHSQEIDNLDMVVTPKLIYPHSPSSNDLVMMHASLNYRNVVSREELKEEYPSKK